MFRVELMSRAVKSLEFYWGTVRVSLLCRALPKDTEISSWSLCDFHYKSLQDNCYLHGLPVFFGTKLFQYKFIE